MPEARIKDYLRESRLFVRRAIAAGLIVILLLGLVVLQLVNLQIVRHDHFITLSRENRVKLVPLPPTRGLIYDRNGVVLAQNLPAHSLEITPEQVADLDQTLRELAQILPISEEDLERFHRLRKQRRRFDSIPIRVRMNEQEVARFAVNRHRFPGVDIQAKLLRDYPQGLLSAHVVGYVGRINQEELQSIDASTYAGTSVIGKTGLEKTYEDVLLGQVGMQQVEVNALGRMIRVLESQPPVPGKNLELFLDTKLQLAAIEALENKNGAAVAIDPRNGGVLALVSKPGFDPNLFVDGISAAAYQALQDSEDNPLFDRAIRGRYPPGSTIKPFLGLAALENGTVRFRQKEYCPGYFQLPNHSHKYRDWKKGGHGAVDLERAIVESCDVYFYELAYSMGVDQMSAFLDQFGFGKRTGIDITGELGGLLPSRDWKRNSRNQAWYPGETLIMGIGQGYFLATPLQLASATATLATNGKKAIPRLVRRIAGSDNPAAAHLLIPQPQQLTVGKAENWNHILQAMAQVVEGQRGTARRIYTDQYRIAGKTGTAQVFTVKQDEEYDEDTIDEKMRDHALFIGFAPADDPKIAVAVLVEHGGHGGAAAAPVARRIMDEYLLETSQ